MWRTVTVGATASAGGRVGALAGVNKLFTPACHVIFRITFSTDVVSTSSRTHLPRRSMSQSLGLELQAAIHVYATSAEFLKRL